MSATYLVGVRIDGNAAAFVRATQQATQATVGMGKAVHVELQKMQQFWNSTQGKLAGFGLSVGMVQLQRNAAQLQKTLTQVSLTAGMSVSEQAKAYEEMFNMVKRNGGVLEDTVGGFNSLIQAGLSYQEALKSISAINIGNAVTGADASILANALTVGSANFGFDLSKGNTAIEMLDKMTASGRLGNAELENLSNIMPKVAAGAQRAGMDFDKTLSFLQALSMVEKQPERLATLADSTTRLFTNLRYAKDAEKFTGVRMFEANGTRRDPVDVLDELRKKYSALKTDAQRFRFMGTAFGSADQDTQRGLSAFLSGELLQKVREFERITKNAGGTLAADLPRAMDNAAKQSERLKNTLRYAVETGFSNPLNEAINKAIQYGLDSKEQGGAGVSGGQLLGGAAVGAAGLYAATRLLPPMLRGLAGRVGGVGAGVATGKALEAAAGVTPVYVTNWSEMSGGGGVGAALGGAVGGVAGRAVLGRLALAGGGLGASLLAGYGVGSLISKGIEGTAVSNAIGRAVAKTLGFFGNQEANAAVNSEWALSKAAAGRPDRASAEIERAIRRSEFKGEVMVRVLTAPGVGADADVMFTNPRIPVRADVGRTNTAAGY